MTTLNLTEPARAALHEAQVEARRLGHDYIGTEHILLGLDRDPSVRAILERLGVTSERLRSALEGAIRRGTSTGPVPGSPQQLPFTTRTLRVMEFSRIEAEASGETMIRPEHVMLALLREEKGIACEILTRLGVRADQITSLRF